jgi:REP element-mobilizing transposase RayT
MILAYHVIFTTYGFWLPNDPRGSWSDYVRSWELLHFGRATQVSTSRSLAKHPHQRPRRQAAKEAMKYPPVHFTGIQARAVGRGVARACGESGYHVHACSILPEHVHMVVGRHEQRVERMVGHFKGRATQQLSAENLHPLASCGTPEQSPPSPWSHRSWRVYLNDEAHVRSAIRYVEKNPICEGKPRQSWSFVVPYGS